MTTGEKVAENFNAIAGFWLRFFAFMIDALLLAALGHCLGFIFFDFLAGLGVWGSLFGYSITLVYFGLCESNIFNGQSLGKKALKIKIVSSSGSLLSLQSSLLRTSVFCAPYFLFNATINFIALPVWAIWLNNFIVYGFGVSAMYLLIFNRRIRQSLHDLVVGSYVVRAQSGSPQLTALKSWHGHIIATALFLVFASLLDPLLRLYYANDQYNALTPTLKKIRELPNINYASEYEYMPTSVNGQSHQQTKSFMTLKAAIARKDIDVNAMADRIIQIVLKDYSYINGYNSVTVSLEYGYNIGISSDWKSKEIAYSVSEWRQQLKM
jgi:uncharacterized RDD family membrane protein YckC